MKCAFCGKENEEFIKLSDRLAYWPEKPPKSSPTLCWNCKRPVNGDMSIMQSVDHSAPTDEQSPSTPTSQKKNAFRAAKLLVLAAMICFIFPFATVSCSETVPLSGFEIMTTLSLHSDVQEEILSDIPLNVFLIFAWVFYLLFFYSTRAQNILQKPEAFQQKYHCGVLSAATICLLIFRLSAGTYYDIVDYIEEGYVEFAWGWWAATLCSAAAAVSVYSSRLYSAISQAAPTPAANSSAADELAKYKSLLDSGAITQEEYDAKKSELLGS